MTDQDVRALARKIFQLEEKVAALSRSRQLTSSSVPITVDGDDGPEVIDVPLATGVSQGVQASFESKYAKELAEQLQEELGPLPEQVREALDEAAEALASAGLAKTEAAQAVADAATASAQATKAVEDALAAASLAQGAAPSWATDNPVAGDAAGKPVGAIWYVRDAAGNVLRMWELTALGWVNRPFDETVIPKLAIGSGTYGTLAGDRLVAKSVTAAQIQALAITANELASNSVVAVKIAANAVTAAKIIAGAVTTDKLNALAVTAEKIAVGAIIADKIAAGAITTAKLAATAIDGMTITGALVRTAPSGQRVQMDVYGLRTFNAKGEETGVLESGDGGFDLRGWATWRSSSPALGYARLSPPTASDSGALTIQRGAALLAIGASDVPGLRPYAMLNAGAGGLELSAGRQVSIRTAEDIYLLSTAGKTRVVSAGGIVLDGPVAFQGDTDWQPIDQNPLATLGPGVIHNFAAYYTGLQARIRGGVMYITGSVTRAAGFPANHVLLTFMERYRPAVAVVQYAYAGGHNFVYYDPGTGQVKLAVPGTGTVTTFGMSYPI